MFSSLYNYCSVAAISMLIASPFSILSQNKTHEYIRCGTMIFDSSNQAKNSLLQWEKWLQEKIKHDSHAARESESNYTIAVIVHILHSGEAIGTAQNIGDEQIISQFDVLNEDYNKNNNDFTTNVPSYFNSYAANCGITFCRATKDTSGNDLPVAGIDRVNIINKGLLYPPYSYNYMENTVKPLTIWDPNKYLNIWVVDISGGLLGYATWPPQASLSGETGGIGTSKTDGLVIMPTAFGRTGQVMQYYDKGRTTVHELGHWLGLRHIWGDAYCGDDYCNDTPLQYDYNSGCPSGVKISCNNYPNGEMYMNFMDYTDDVCMGMFSNDQKTRMITALTNSPMRMDLLNNSAQSCTTLTTNPAIAAAAFSITNFGNNIYITGNGRSKKYFVNISNMLGENIHKQIILPEQNNNICIGTFLPGIYIVNIQGDEFYLTKKILLTQ